MSQSPSGLSRRTLFAGAGTLGALTAVVTLTTAPQVVQSVIPEERKPPPERGGGYALSEHVKHYYRTTSI